MACCGGMRVLRVNRTSTAARVYGNSQQPRAAALSDFPKLADAPPVLVTDWLLFRWARYPKLLKLLPIMTEVRALEVKIGANDCKSCRKPPEIDMSVLERVKKILAECPDEAALLVKQAANVLKYKVVYKNSSGVLKEVIR